MLFIWRWKTKRGQWSQCDRNPSPDGGEFWKLWTSLNSWSRTEASGSLMKPAGSNSRHKDISVVLTFLDIFRFLISRYHKIIPLHSKSVFLNPSSESPKTMIDHFLISDGFKFQGENGGNDWGVKVVDPKCPPGATSDGFHLFGGWYLAGWIFVWKISVETMLMYHTGMNQICESQYVFVFCVFLLPEVKIRVLQSGIRCGWEQRKEDKEGHM